MWIKKGDGLINPSPFYLDIRQQFLVEAVVCLLGGQSAFPVVCYRAFVFGVHQGVGDGLLHDLGGDGGNLLDADRHRLRSGA